MQAKIKLSIRLISTLLVLAGIASCGGDSDDDPTLPPDDPQVIDSDSDGISDDVDNCPSVANPDQADADSDGEGDVCDTDGDNDGVPDTSDNCVDIPNPNQEDADNDGAGDACDIDDDNDNLIEISTLEELDFIRNDLAGQTLDDGEGNVMALGCAALCNGYELIADLDFDTNGNGEADAGDAFFDPDGDGSNNGWLPIGDLGAPFLGNFDGNGFTISNLFISRVDDDLETSGENIGLFSAASVAVGQTAFGLIQNLNVDSADVTGSRNVGALVGTGAGLVNYSSISTSGVVLGASESEDQGSNIGGIFGALLAGSLTDCSADVIVENTSPSGDAVGGVIGDAGGADISLCRSSGSVSGLDSVGGLVGSINGAEIDSSSSSADVDGVTNVGGLLGLAGTGTFIDIIDSGASGDVTGAAGGENIGGLIGQIVDFTTTNNDGEIDAFVVGSEATGTVTALLSENVGGLIGLATNASIDDSSASGDVNGGTFVGGLIGFLGSSEATEVRATGDVTGMATVGGLAGSVGSSSVSQSFATGDVSLSEEQGVSPTEPVGGGLIGITGTSSVEDNFSTGSVTGIPARSVLGGLIGAIPLATATVERNLAVNTLSSARVIGTVVGLENGNVTYADNFFVSNANVQIFDAIGATTDLAGTPISPSPTAADNNTGGLLFELEAVTAPGPDGFFTNWSEDIWDFGSTSQLPGLIIGDQIFRFGEID